MPGPVTDVRAGVLRRRYHNLFGGVELPVPVEAIAEDLCGLGVDEVVGLEVSGMLIPSERRIYTNATEPPAGRRFTLTHELGHWVCQCVEVTPRRSTAEPRASLLTLEPVRLSARRTSSPLSS